MVFKFLKFGFWWYIVSCVWRLIIVVYFMDSGEVKIGIGM